MIPRRIRLHNFLSYRDCEVDLSGLGLAVLCGPNGHGKSALLDAMTWALWGEGRGRLEDDRIHLGEQEMLVDFEFESGGDTFQVIRKRTRGRGAGSLELFQLATGGTRTPLTGSTMSETQAEVIRRVRMDYDTFVNSAFIAQGRANEFTRKRPSERKEVFRRVLGLERYQALADGATERRKAAAIELKELDRNASETAEQVRQLPAIEEELSAIEGERTTLRPELGCLEETVVQLKQVEADHVRLQRDARDALERVDALRTDVARRQETIDALEAQLAAAREVLARGDELRAAHERFRELRRLDEDMAERQREATEIEARIAEADRTISVELARLESERAACERDLRAAEAEAGEIPGLEQEEARLAAEREAVASAIGESEDLERQAGELRALAAAAGAEANQAAEQNRQLKDREAQLETTDASCPVCLRPLGPADLDHVRQEYAKQREDLRVRYDAARATKVIRLDGADELASRATALRDTVTRKEASLRELEREVHAGLVSARKSQDSLEDLRAAFASANATIESERFAVEARSERQTAIDRLATVGYDAAAHAAVRQQLREAGSVEDDYRALLLAQERAVASVERIERERVECSTREEELAAAEQRLVEARDALMVAEDVTPRLREAQENLDALRHRESALVLRIGQAQARRDTLRELQARLEMARETMIARKEEEGLYGDLARAFGRDGVQAMLIDQALPLVEHTANDMLDRMTGGRIHVDLATQRTLASGKVSETLDIRISDELGTRDYEMYSGGEAFRVDLSLRIALARLLAERSGAALPTLIIDEGFGTQDAEGIDRLVQSITAIQDEFRLILVVTHIDELRERFERRIEVTKDRDRGSVARVM